MQAEADQDRDPYRRKLTSLLNSFKGNHLTGVERMIIAGVKTRNVHNFDLHDDNKREQKLLKEKFKED